MSAARPAIAAAVCTYQRYDMLAEALGSLAAQTLPPAYCEILVVDNSPDAAREYVRWAKQKGVDGFKIIGNAQLFDPAIFAALTDAAKKLSLGTTTHMPQTGVVQTNVLQAARMGLGSMEHWYDLPESLFADRVVQDFPLDYNYNDESHRFGQAGRLWKQAAPPGEVE